MSTPKSARARLEAKVGKPVLTFPSEDSYDLMFTAGLPFCPKCAGTGKTMPREFFISLRGALYLSHGITEPILLRAVGIGPDRPGVKAATPAGTRPEIAVLTLRFLLVAVNRKNAIRIVRELANGGKPTVDVSALGDTQKALRDEVFQVLRRERPDDYLFDVIDMMDAAKMPECSWCVGAQSVITSDILAGLLRHLRESRDIPASLVAKAAGVSEAILSRRKPGGVNASKSMRSDLTHATLHCLLEAEGTEGAEKVLKRIVADSKAVKP